MKRVTGLTLLLMPWIVHNLVICFKVQSPKRANYNFVRKSCFFSHKKLRYIYITSVSSINEKQIQIIAFFKRLYQNDVRLPFIQIFIGSQLNLECTLFGIELIILIMKSMIFCHPDTWSSFFVCFYFQLYSQGRIYQYWNISKYQVS